MKQQTLPLKLPQEKIFENFIPGKNQKIIDALKKFTANSIYLWGNPESGCSYLLQATCNAWQTKGRYAIYLDLQQTIDLDLLLQGALDGAELVAIDHLEAAIGKQALEEKLFHIFNHSLQAPFKMLWAAQQAPAQLQCKLQDLQSRLSSSMIFQVKELGDEDKKILVRQYAERKGFKLTATTAAFFLNHFPRKLSELLLLLDKLDALSLAEKRRITIPFLKKFL